MRNFINLVLPFFYGSEKRYARWGLIGLLLLSCSSTIYGYWFIQWNRRFYDALELRDLHAFIYESWVFLGLAITYVLTFSLMRYFGQQYALRWRMWMTKGALSKWLSMTNRGELEGSDQRIQEDLQRFTTIVERFLLDCFNAILLIVLYTPLLFIQTSNLKLLNMPLAFVLLSVSIIYTAIGMAVSAKIANPLIQLEYDNQKLEAEFRYNLVHVRDGEQRSMGFFQNILSDILANYRSRNNKQKNFNLWHKSYDQFSFLLPFILLGSNYFAGLLTLGALMQVKSTFSRIRNSMAYLLDHYTELTDMLAIAKRLFEFYVAADIDLKQYTQTLIFGSTSITKSSAAIDNRDAG